MPSVRYVLDTNTVSFLMKGVPRVVDRLVETPRTEVGVPQPVLAELEYGVRRLARSKRKTWLQDRLRLVRAIPRVPWTDAVSEQFGRIKTSLEKAGTPIEDFDVAVAAHAIAHGCTLVSSDAAHMLRIRGLKVEDWNRTR